jgi:hypothetical protein
MDGRTDRQEWMEGMGWMHMRQIEIEADNSSGVHGDVIVTNNDVK